jgi:hypothetical protein
LLLVHADNKKKHLSKYYSFVFCVQRVFENRILRRVFEPKRGEVTGEWRKLHSEELYNLYSSPNSVRHMKSRRMMCAGCVACMGEERKVYKVGGKVQRKETTRKTEV